MKWSIQDHTVRTLAQYCDLAHISLTCKRFHFKDYAVIHCREQCMVPSSFVPMLQIKKKWKSFKRHGYKKVITAQPEIEFRSLDPISDCSRSPSQQRRNIRCVWEAYRSCSTCRLSLLSLRFSYVLPSKKHRLTEWKTNSRVRVKWWGGGCCSPPFTHCGSTEAPEEATMSLVFPLPPGLLYVGFSACMFGLYSFMPVVIKKTSATSVNLSLLTADLYTLFCGLFLFHYKVSWVSAPVWRWYSVGKNTCR